MQTVQDRQSLDTLSCSSTCSLLSTSVVMFNAQSTLNTSFELKVLHDSSSSDQFTDTSRPHQNVSKKHVDIIAEAVKAAARKSAFRSHGIVGGNKRKYRATIASFGR